MILRYMLVSTSHDIVNVLLVDNNAALRAPSFGTQLRAEVVDIDLAVAESLHGLQTIPVRDGVSKFVIE